MFVSALKKTGSYNKCICSNFKKLVVVALKDFWAHFYQQSDSNPGQLVVKR